LFKRGAGHNAKGITREGGSASLNESGCGFYAGFISQAICVFLQGFLKNVTGKTWFFCGEFVVKLW
jgi:hypothetical protein